MPQPKALPPQAYLRQCFIYSPDLGILMWRPRPREHFSDDHWWHLWLSRYASKPAGSIRKGRPYLNIRIDGKRYYAHRIIWKLTTGEERAEIDHKDGNGLNNRWHNLRPASRQQQLANTLGWKDHALPKGVRLSDTKSLRYQARARRDGKDVHLGTFDTPEAAHAAYLTYAQSTDGAFFASSSQRTPQQDQHTQ